MAQDERDLLELLKFELKFVEDGGYGRSPHTPWRCQLIFEDSPTCPNFDDPARPHACSECRLTRFVPAELRSQPSPCRLIPLNDQGETVDYFYRCGTQLDLEEALAGWLRNQISRIEEQREHPSTEDADSGSDRLENLRRKQWLAFAGNLYLLANRRRENHDYRVACALYGRALDAAEKAAAGEHNQHSLTGQVRKDQQAVFELLHSGEKHAPSEKAQAVGC